MELHHKAGRKPRFPAVFIYRTRGGKCAAHVYYPDERPAQRVLAPTLKQLFGRLTFMGLNHTGYVRHPHTSPMWARQRFWQNMPGSTRLMGWTQVREDNEKSEVAA